MKKQQQSQKQRKQKIRRKKPTQQIKRTASLAFYTPATPTPFTSTLPVVDGHFWVERNGQIIDPHFRHYDNVAAIRGVTNKKNYHPASPHIQEHYINLYLSYWDSVSLFPYRVNANNCAYNAFYEVQQRGGKVVFGSMGLGEEGSVFWEYGDPKWNNIQRFRVR